MSNVIENYGVKDIKTLEGIEEYIRLFNYLITRHNNSFIKFTNYESENDKVDILRFFRYLYPNYKFYLSTQDTALFYEKK